MRFSQLAVHLGWLEFFPWLVGVSDWLVGVFPWLAGVFLAVCCVFMVGLKIGRAHV